MQPGIIWSCGRGLIRIAAAARHEAQGLTRTQVSRPASGPDDLVRPRQSLCNGKPRTTAPSRSCHQLQGSTPADDPLRLFPAALSPVAIASRSSFEVNSHAVHCESALNTIIILSADSKHHRVPKLSLQWGATGFPGFCDCTPEQKRSASSSTLRPAP